MGVILVEQHVRQTLAIADRVYVMRGGQIVLEGAAADFARPARGNRVVLYWSGAA